jgi:hypothetical protein
MQQRLSAGGMWHQNAARRARHEGESGRAVAAAADIEQCRLRAASNQKLYTVRTGAGGGPVGGEDGEHHWRGCEV